MSSKVDLITLVADGKATGSIHFNLSSVLFIRTSSHMSGRWYFPIFYSGMFIGRTEQSRTSPG